MSLEADLSGCGTSPPACLVHVVCSVYLVYLVYPVYLIERN